MHYAAMYLKCVNEPKMKNFFEWKSIFLIFYVFSDTTHLMHDDFIRGSLYNTNVYRFLYNSIMTLSYLVKGFYSMREKSV